MHEYTVKAIKPHKGGAMPEMDKFPTLRIPIDKAWVGKYKVGKDITLSVTGKLVGAHLNEPEEAWNRNEFEVEVRAVECSPMGEMEEYMEED